MREFIATYRVAVLPPRPARELTAWEFDHWLADRLDLEDTRLRPVDEPDDVLRGPFAIEGVLDDPRPARGPGHPTHRSFRVRHACVTRAADGPRQAATRVHAYLERATNAGRYETGWYIEALEVVPAA